MRRWQQPAEAASATQSVNRRQLVTGGSRRRGVALFALVSIMLACAVASAWLFHGVLQWAPGLLYVGYDTFLIAFVAFSVRRLLRQPAQTVSDERATLPTVTVLIAARNEAGILPHCLDSLLQPRDQPDEILLMDDGSTDGTRELLASRYGVRIGGSAATDERVRSNQYRSLSVIYKPNSGKADSLNQGLRSIDTEIVVTLDADTIVEPGAIHSMRLAFAANAQLAAACGVLDPKCPPTFSGRLFQWFQTYEYLRAFLARLAWMRADALLLVSGAFAGYRRSVLEKLGGFDPQSLVEDYEVIHRLYRYATLNVEPWHVGVVKAAIASTDSPSTLPGFLRQRRRWFAGFLQTQYRCLDMTGNARFGNVGRLMLPLKLIDTLQPLFGLAAFVLLVTFTIRGAAVLKIVLTVIAVKLMVDFAFQLWGIGLYGRWIGRRPAPREWLLGALASLIEPFSFQLLRHAGALLGWFAMLSGRLEWAPQRRALPAAQLP